MKPGGGVEMQELGKISVLGRGGRRGGEIFSIWSFSHQKNKTKQNNE